ncbi:Lanthionine synthetase c family protein [Favolaschia claudopus]|uniref:Lanthionine synthetase c family protein n=1 Tax=Favolaschia claudopus TaxID=2862362 RepID=A0AAW0DIZ1_9AGAR
MPSQPLRYIRHTNSPPSDFQPARRDIETALSAEVKHVQDHVSKIRKTGSVYVGITGAALMAQHLANAQLERLAGLSPAELLPFADFRLTHALSFSPTSLSNPSAGSHSSFLETAVGIATLILMRAIEHVIATGSVSTSTFNDSWSACIQLLTSAASMTLSEDRRQDDGDDSGCEVLYGRAGLLYALLRLRSLTKREDINAADAETAELLSKIRAICSEYQLQLLAQSIIIRGQRGAAMYQQDMAGTAYPTPPLMWSWHGKRYLGAAHGLAGILHMLLLCPEDVILPYMDSILLTVEWLIGCQDIEGNWPAAAPTGHPTGTTKELVQWCHGATGVILLLCTVLRCATTNSATPLLGKVIGAVQAGASLVYRHGLLSKGVGLCHGVGGSVFALLAVSDLLDPARKAIKTKTNAIPSKETNYYLSRAVHLAQLATTHESYVARGDMRVPDHPWSLYEGMAGMCCAWAEVLRRLTLPEGRPCERSYMPGFDDVNGDTWASW